jgi:drug/metabolite transporter (DMT)-like permease
MLYTSYKFFETDAMSLVQSIVLFVLGAISYAVRESGAVKHCQPHALQNSPNVHNTGNACTRVPAHMQLALAISIAGNVLLTNYATEFLSFPIQVVFKSSKLLMAMFVRAVIFRKPNKRIDYYCAVMLSLGLVGFMWPSSSHSENADEGAFDPTSKFTIGLICVVGSLIAEAVMLNVQEFYLFQRYEVSTVSGCCGATETHHRI